MLMEPVGIESTGGDYAALPKAHDRPLAELLFNLAESDVERLATFFLLINRHAGLLGGPATAGPCTDCQDGLCT